MPVTWLVLTNHCALFQGRVVPLGCKIPISVHRLKANSSSALIQSSSLIHQFQQFDSSTLFPGLAIMDLKPFKPSAASYKFVRFGLKFERIHIFYASTIALPLSLPLSLPSLRKWNLSIHSARSILKDGSFGVAIRCDVLLTKRSSLLSIDVRHSRGDYLRENVVVSMIYWYLCQTISINVGIPTPPSFFLSVKNCMYLTIYSIL